MLDLGLAAAREVLGVAIRGEASRVEEANRRLHAKLVLERAQRGGGVEGPVTPGGAGEAILEEDVFCLIGCFLMYVGLFRLCYCYCDLFELYLLLMCCSCVLN